MIYVIFVNWFTGLRCLQIIVFLNNITTVLYAFLHTSTYVVKLLLSESVNSSYHWWFSMIQYICILYIYLYINSFPVRNQYTIVGRVIIERRWAVFNYKRVGICCLFLIVLFLCFFWRVKRKTILFWPSVKPELRSAVTYTLDTADQKLNSVVLLYIGCKIRINKKYLFLL